MPGAGAAGQGPPPEDEAGSVVGEVQDFDIVDPRPEALVESLRAFGYTLPAAVADLIDNSISAKAHRVRINAYWAGQDSWFSVIDDGMEMSELALVEAMRAGSQSPREVRRRDDLGRFGLGLKTASFSQAREPTVRSMQGNAIAARRWDLDVVSTRGSGASRMGSTRRLGSCSR